VLPPNKAGKRILVWDVAFEGVMPSELSSSC
jgi:hypothetical protein